MLLTTRQLGFVFWFLLTWLLLLLLGESYLGYFLLGLASLGMLFWQLITRKNWQYLSQIHLMWLVFWLGLLGSALMTTLWPLTLRALASYGFAFISFWFFSNLPQKIFPQKTFAWSLMGLGLVMVCLSWFFMAFPSLASLLPGMNLLYSTYGHNHLASYLILVLPSSWWVSLDFFNQGFGKKYFHKKRVVIFLIPLILTLSLLTSFGRVAVSIGLLELSWLYWQVNKRYTKPFKGLVLLFCVVLVIKAVFSLAPMVDPNFTCPVPKLEKQLCKPLTTEARPTYWNRALRMIQARPLRGFGPGTFGIAVNRFTDNSFSGSAYAHNAFLQNMAEWGVIPGVIFIILMFTLLINAGPHQRNSLSGALWMGAVGIYLNALFDFDWNFVGILSLTFVFLALLLREKKSILDGLKLKQQPSFSKLPSSQLPWHRIISLQLTKVMFYGAIFSLILLASLYAYTEILIRSGQVKKAFTTFPYFHWHRKIYEANSDFSSQETQQLAQIYRNQGEVYSLLITNETDRVKKQALREKLFVLQPWQVATTRDDLEQMIHFYFEEGDLQIAAGNPQIAAESLQLAEQYLQQVWTMFTNSEQETGFGVDYDRWEKLLDQSLVLAEKQVDQVSAQTPTEAQAPTALLKKILSHQDLSWEQKEDAAELLIQLGNQVAASDLTLTVQAYQLAQENIEWILSQHQLWFEVLPWESWPTEKLTEYVLLTADWQNEKIGWKDEVQQQIQGEVAKRLLVAQNWTQLAEILSLDFWSEYDYQWRQEFVQKLNPALNKMIEQKEYAPALQLAQAAQNFIPHEYWQMTLPGNIAVLQGDLTLAEREYQKCNQDFIEVTDEDFHYECQTSLDNLNRVKTGELTQGELQSLTLDRYFQVSQIIRGEAVWQDFVE